ncbi:MAG TPA: 3-dehydroquinate synthase [Chloroflexota bacterium]|nr:3-dehydroquinate synthase [Chloroflexota bacterium]
MNELVIGRGVLDRVGELMRDRGLKGRAFLVSNDRIYPVYGERVFAGLRDAGFETAAYQLPDGEPTKSLTWAGKLYDWLAEQRAERNDAVVALGGGVVGDVTGFAAATFLRGMPLVQVPTTVLAQIDSSIGGKVAVNHPLGKNLIGAFHSARLIVGDVETLRSLPPRELAAGWAEAVKCGMILDPELLDLLDEHASGLCDPTSAVFRSSLLADIVERCAEHKVRVVTADLREANLRMILNYGHTIGHALEAALNYEGLLHGEAVSVGMEGAAAIAVRLGFLAERDAERQSLVLQRFGLPTRFPAGAPPVSVDAVLDGIGHDKKVRDSRVQWVLLDRIGKTRIESGVPNRLVRAVVEELVTG